VWGVLLLLLLLLLLLRGAPVRARVVLRASCCRSPLETEVQGGMQEERAKTASCNPSIF
jgi:hypothetical protein